MSLRLIIAALLCPMAWAQAPSCLNDDAKKVDWYFIYKQPNGFTYSYMDSDGTSSTLPVQTGKSLKNTVDNPLGKTLHQIYEHKTDYGWLLYNDEDPLTGKTTGSGTAHAKGVLAADVTGSGFWLIHSVPKFPDLTGTDFTWTASDIYGQSFLCISLDKTGIDAAATQLQYAVVQVFSKNIPSNIATSLPAMAATASGTTKSGTNEQVFKSVGGNSFTHFVKNADWGKDLYADLVQPALKIDMYVETWRRAPYALSYCKSNTTHSYATMNVEGMSFGSGGPAYHYTKDHSKWGVSASSSAPYVCVGDINRMPSQRARGGGTMCFESKALNAALLGAIATHDSCGSEAMIFT